MAATKPQKLRGRPTNPRTEENMPVAEATLAGPVALIERKQTFEELEGSAKLQTLSPAVLGDLSSLLRIIKDLPSDTESSRKLIEQVAQLTLPIRSIVHEVENINSVLLEKLAALGASDDTIRSFDDVFPFACVDVIENALIENIEGGNTLPDSRSDTLQKDASVVDSDEDAISGGVGSIILEDVGPAPAKTSVAPEDSVSQIIPETPPLSDGPGTAALMTISSDWQRYSMGPDERILRKTFYPAVKRTWMGSWQAVRRTQLQYQEELFPIFKLFSGVSKEAPFDERRTIINDIMTAYDRIQDRAPGSYETVFERLYDVQQYDKISLRSMIAGMFSQKRMHPGERSNQIEDYLRPFCQINKRFMPELWKCWCMRAQLLNEDGTAVPRRLWDNTLLLDREDAYGICP